MLRSSKDPADRRKCIELLEMSLSGGAGTAENWFDLASCYDFLGEEAKAEPAYLRALNIGYAELPADKQPRLFLQLGSTLRNNGKLQEAVVTLEEGTNLFPEHAAMKVFLAIALFTAGDFVRCSRTMAASILAAETAGWDGYEKAIRHYFESELLSD